MIASTLATKIAGAGIAAMLASTTLGGTAAAGTRAPAARQSAHEGQQTARTRPQGRAWPSLAYDPALNEVVLFGGDNASTIFGDTWTLRHGTWTRQHPARSPSPRTGAAMVYDAATTQLLLFGGSKLIGTAGGFLGDTWVWTGHTWRKLHPATSPPARHNADTIYDAPTGNVVLFGGYDGHYLGDTWTWNGSNWAQQNTPTAPAPRDTGSFAYDAATGTGILYGGFNGIAPFIDTWSWNGTTWTQLTPAVSPGTVAAAWQMAYDPASQQLLLFGGGQTNHTNAGATWDFNGSTWTQLSPATAPAGRGLASMTYNSRTGQVVLFGGQGVHQDTYPPGIWTWDGSTWQRNS